VVKIRIVYHDGTEETLRPESTRVSDGVLHVYPRAYSDEAAVHIPLASIRKWEVTER